MYFNASSPEGRSVYAVNPLTGKTFLYCFEADTDKKQLGIYISDDVEDRILPPLTKKWISVDFDIVNKETGEVIAEARI